MEVIDKDGDGQVDELEFDAWFVTLRFSFKPQFHAFAFS